MSNMQKLLAHKKAAHNYEEISDDEAKEQRTAFLMDANTLSVNTYYKGYLIALEQYDGEAKDQVFSKLNSSGERSWSWCGADGKKSLSATFPGMSGAWRCMTADDYDTWKGNVMQEMAELTKIEYTFVDKGVVPLNTFVDDKYIAKQIAKAPEQAMDDSYFFGGEAGSQTQVDECVGRNLELLMEQDKASPHTPPKKRRTCK